MSMQLTDSVSAWITHSFLFSLSHAVMSYKLTIAQDHNYSMPRGSFGGPWGLGGLGRKPRDQCSYASHYSRQSEVHRGGLHLGGCNPIVPGVLQQLDGGTVQWAARFVEAGSLKYTVVAYIWVVAIQLYRACSNNWTEGQCNWRLDSSKQGRDPHTLQQCINSCSH